VNAHPVWGVPAPQTGDYAVKYFNNDGPLPFVSKSSIPCYVKSSGKGITFPTDPSKTYDTITGGKLILKTAIPTRASIQFNYDIGSSTLTIINNNL
jgi:hypothetical protein